MLDSLDISLLRQINVNRITSLDSIFVFITQSGPIIAAIVPLSFIILGYMKKKRVMWMNGFMIAAPYLLAVVLSNTTKTLVARPRPYSTYPYIQKLSEGGSGSFPSGHTSDAFSIAMIISLFFPRPMIIIPAFIWAILVGYSRMDLGVHYPTDVLTGACVGIGSSLFCSWLYKRSRKKEPILK
jgi:membrane-associated phospholipid phosphatase